MRLGDIASALVPHGNRCWRKEKHASRGKAEAHLRSILRSDGVKEADLLCVYKCPHCQQWHIGRSRPPQGEKRR